MSRKGTKAEDYIYDCIKDYPECKYRASEWVRTKMPRCPNYDDCDADPKDSLCLMVNIRDLMAVQGYVNKPTVHYYVTKLRNKEETVERIRVKRYLYRGRLRWVVDNGTHRVEAYRYLGKTEIPAVWGFD